MTRTIWCWQRHSNELGTIAVLSVPRESQQAKGVRARAIAVKLETAYPKSTCALIHDTPFQLLVATVLSAQATDAAVNGATRGLFAQFPDARAMTQAPQHVLQGHIKGLGLWRAKAKHIQALAQGLIDRHDGIVPASLAELVELPGVGRKTATAVLGQAFGIAAGITVDAHMLRINRLLGLCSDKDPTKMAQRLERFLPAAEWVSYTHRIIDHGRLVCVARRPRCGVCPLQTLCPSAFSPKSGYEASNDGRTPASARGMSWLAVAGVGAGGTPGKGAARTEAKK